MTNDKEITITYRCDSQGNHTCSDDEMVSIMIRIFTNKMNAIHFIAECTSCNHNIAEIYPELFWWKNDSKETTNTNEELEAYRINNIY